MAKDPTTETDADDNGDETETDSNSGESTDENEETETDSSSEGESSSVTPREKELRKLLRVNEKKLARLEKADEEARRTEMTDNEKLREDLSERDSKIEELIRSKVAAEHGLDDELAERLRGVTEEELSEDAERLSKLLKPKTSSSTDVGLGGSGSSDELSADPIKMHRAAMAGRQI